MTMKRRGFRSDRREESLILDLRTTWVPTREAADRHIQILMECWANMPIDELGGRTPWEVGLTEEGRREVEAMLREQIIGRGPLLKEYLAQLEPLREPGRRYVEAYQKSGGLLNIFAERVTEADDDFWHQLVRERIEGVEFPDEEARARAWREIEGIWNETPSELFSNLTPAQVWAGGGGEETDLTWEFMERLREECGDRGYSSQGEMIRTCLLLLRTWQTIPQRALGGRTPAEVILEERDEI
ncbi:MAG TPA: DUF2384 domain-containing protein, partial [Anaerolineae bacterium]|nr:DUF2384 domain-containing protein [Anaerolineae bacterium]